jgi:fructose-1,6-bisphosphatase/inositol monophosphatase family enzyme
VVSTGRATLFVEVFLAAARQAAAVARSLQGEVRRRSKPGGGSPEAEALSAADLACQELILLRLAESLPDVAMDAEEDTPALDLFAPASPGRPLIVLDPIDGSRNYLDGSDDYAVMAAWIEEGHYRASVVHFPVQRVSYWAVQGGGCHRRDDRGPAERVAIGGLPPRLLVPPRMRPAARRRLRRFGDEVLTSRCSAVDATAPVIGRARASINMRGPDRRRAIGFLLTLEAGGAVMFRDHRPWCGEDPAGAGWAGAAHAVADSPGAAVALLDTVC